MNAVAAIPMARALPITDAGEAPNVVASPERIVAWAMAAASGDRFAYATRTHLPLGSPGARAMRNLSDRGLVFLTQARCRDGSGEFTYTATRSSQPWRDAVPEAAKPVLEVKRTRADDSGDYQAAEAILPFIVRAAQFGRPCPTDKELARRAKVQPSSIKAAFDALRSMHAIVVHPAPAPTLRLVTIVETGARTGYAKKEER